MNSKILPTTKYFTTVKNIQAGAIFSRDWAPLHSNQDWAINKGKLTNIIMNNYTLNGLVIKYVTDIYNESTRIGKVKFKINKPITPDKNLEFHGSIIKENKVSNEISILKIKVEVKVSDETYASANVVAGISLNNTKSNSPWKIDADTWISYIKNS